MKPKLVGKGCVREKIKIIAPFHSYQTHIRKLKKNSKKIQKIKRYHYGFISSLNRLEKAKKERKEKLSFRFVPSRRVIEIKKKKIAKKLKKLKYTIMDSF